MIDFSDNAPRINVTSKITDEGGGKDISTDYLLVELAFDRLELCLSLDYQVLQCCDTKIVLADEKFGGNEEEVQTNYEIFEGKKKDMKRLVKIAKEVKEKDVVGV
ncbi:hypothetical protein COU49_01030 [Candidatus Nomurabacteria bacterium CG10_big_fil_rev_8_21_14_0_10_35_16]|uniref:Uncharacterized protein n=1 Tax=Candidatus Nomurabacteria bacterium CG10_big_fil_rev_8_21_14_0_10_35_16 TaxID=1974731 RepID=A0A2H0TBQ9_9BACT|nr:MAG: hypothetical protein COU49_01030 [Candidatus Nomurabacteria bacterium CG10_big_fil_rev_8_21_14_0_10_35_16]